MKKDKEQAQKKSNEMLRLWLAIRRERKGFRSEPIYPDRKVVELFPHNKDGELEYV